MTKYHAIAMASLTLLACVEEPALMGVGSFQLDATNADLRNGTATVHVTIADEFGFASPVTLALADPPSGLTADPLTVAIGGSGGDLVLHGQPGLVLDQDVIVTGTADGTVLKVPVRVTAGFDTGSLDASFGDHGIATIASPAGCGGLAFESDGGIVVGLYGGAAAQGGVARLRADGVLDAGFGQAGVAALAGTAGGPHQILVDADGSLLAAGDDTSSDQPLHGRLWRLDAHGAAVASFGTGGFAEPVPQALYRLSQSGGKTYLLGPRTIPAPPFMARMVADGSLDPQLGISGLVRLLFFADAAALADGSGWLIAGSVGTLVDRDLRGRLAVLTVDGDEDPDRVDGGDALTRYSSPFSTATATYVLYSQFDFVAFARATVIQKLDADLMPDPSFVTAPDTEIDLEVFAAQPDGKLLVKKAPGMGVLDHIVRLNTDGTSDPMVRIAIGNLVGNRLPTDAHLDCGPAVDALGRVVLGYTVTDGSTRLVRIQL